MSKDRDDALRALEDDLVNALEAIEQHDPADVGGLLRVAGVTRGAFVSLVPGFPSKELDAFLDAVSAARAAPEEVVSRLRNRERFAKGPLRTALGELYDAVIEHMTPVRPGTNVFYSSAEKAIDAAFDDLGDNIPFGDECSWYVTKRFTPRPGTNGEGLEEKFHALLESWGRTDQKHMVLVHGSTGHGKSSFINYFYRSWLPRNRKGEADKTLYVRVHVSSASARPDFEEDVDHQISDELHRQHPSLEKEENMLRVWEEIYDFDNDFHKMMVRAKYPFLGSKEAKLKWIDSRYSARPWDRHTTTRHADWNRARINFLAKHGYRAVLFFDNADQANREVQMAAFRMARHKLEWLPVRHCTAIVAVRDYLVNRAKTELAVEAKPYQSFPVSPPDIQEVIGRRAKVAAQACREKYGRDHFTMDFRDPSLARFSFTVTDVERFFLEVLRCFQHTDVRPFLYEIANQNVRTVLGMIHMVLSSPLLTNDKIIEFLADTPRSDRLLAPHEVLYCLLASDPARHFFLPHESPLLNLYDIGDHRHLGNSLIQLKILSVFDQQEWVGVRDLLEDFAQLGYYREMIRVALDQLLGSRLLYSNDGVSLRDDKIHRVERTAAGRVYWSDVVKRLYYLQLVAYKVSNMSDDLKARLPRSQARNGQWSRIIDRIKSAIVLYHHVRLSEERESSRVGRMELKGGTQIASLAPELRERIASEVGRIFENDPDKIAFLEEWLADSARIPLD